MTISHLYLLLLALAVGFVLFNTYYGKVHYSQGYQVFDRNRVH